MFGFSKKRSAEDILLDAIIASNGELLEHLDSTIRYLLHYCEKNGIELPNENQIRFAVERSQKLLRALPINQTELARKVPKFCSFSVDFWQSFINRLFTRIKFLKSTDPNTRPATEMYISHVNRCVN